jgi:parallel beta-helix repeat protein
MAALIQAGLSALARIVLCIALALLVANPAWSATLTVRSGESIEAAINRAAPGDEVAVEPGTYREMLFIDKDGIKLHGVIRGGAWPVLDGENKLDNGIITSGHTVTVENFWVRHFRGNGIMTQGSNNFRIVHNVVEGPCFYGIFPQYGKNGLVARNLVYNTDDAAIYVGMSESVDVTDNETYGSFSGIEAENSKNMLIEGNYAHDNSTGIMTSILPGLPVKSSDNLIIRHNVIVKNNELVKAPPGSIAVAVPSGVGVVVLGTNHTVVEDNVIANNDSAAVFIEETGLVDPTPDDKIDPFPENIQVLRNQYWSNGNKPQRGIEDMLEAAGLKQGVDVLSTGKGHGNCVADQESLRTLGTNRYAVCAPGTTTASVTTLQTAEPVVAPAYTLEQKGRLTYMAVCSGCHTYDARLIGPPMVTIKALYGKDAKRVADWIAHPTHKRQDYPQMPSQSYLSEDIRMAVANYILNELQH